MTTNLKDRYAGKCSELAEKTVYQDYDDNTNIVQEETAYKEGFNVALDLVQKDVEGIVKTLQHISDYANGEFGWSELAEEALAKFKGKV